jgi:hypothetical protein
MGHSPVKKTCVSTNGKNKVGAGRPLSYSQELDHAADLPIGVGDEGFAKKNNSEASTSSNAAT